MATKNSEFEGSLVVERKDTDRLRQNKENNGYMIKPAVTKDTYEYGYNHFKNVHKGVRKYQEHKKLLLGTNVSGMKSLMLYTTVNVSYEHISWYGIFLSCQ